MAKDFTKASHLSSKTRKTIGKSIATLLAIVLHDQAQQTVSSPGMARRSRGFMSLHTSFGGRKYLNVTERRRFAAAAEMMSPQVRVFCLVLMWSGCRISEALAITPLAIDRDAGIIAIETLKRRRARVIRQVPLPSRVIDELTDVFDLPAREQDASLAGKRLWQWSRSTGWRHVKNVMRRASVSGSAAMPKGLRHAFGVVAFQAVPPHIVQRWLGHASLRTTAIYGDVSGREERFFAKRLWSRW
jgi:integrase/recombinase XerD